MIPAASVCHRLPVDRLRQPTTGHTWTCTWTITGRLVMHLNSCLYIYRTKLPPFIQILLATRGLQLLLHYSISQILTFISVISHSNIQWRLNHTMTKHWGFVFYRCCLNNIRSDNSKTMKMMFKCIALDRD